MGIGLGGLCGLYLGFLYLGRNQNVAFKNMEIHVEQLTKDFKAKAAKEVPNSSTSFGHCKVIFADDDAQSVETYSNETSKLHKVSSISNCDMQVSKKDNEGPLGVLSFQLPPKELNPRSFTLPCNTGSLNMYALVDLGDPNETMILGRPFLATIHAQINVFHREISLGIWENRILFDMNGNVPHPTVPIKNFCMANSI
ncbi:hypothetical protein Tco_1106390 [Tanacetum coccineum]